MDSNFQYAEAVKVVVAPFSCVSCLGRVGAPVGVLRFSSFFMSGKPFDGAWLCDIGRANPLALIAARFDDRVAGHVCYGFIVQGHDPQGLDECGSKT
jgi:hypothetical protein